MTVEEILRKTAEAMRDPERVVLNSHHIFETSEGAEVESVHSACRACAYGHVWLIAGHDMAIEMDEEPHPFRNVELDFTFGRIDATEAADRLDALADEYAQVTA